jgi:serine/threonine protein phosphatase PrpC
MALYREEGREPENTRSATQLLQSGSGFAPVEGGIVHFIDLAATMPSQTNSTGVFTTRAPSRGACWAIFEGHGGGDTAKYIAERLPGTVLATTAGQSGIQNVSTEILKAFGQVDRDLLDNAQHLLMSKCSTAGIMNFAATAMSGSCALVALLDSKKKALYVANIGDSRAVLARWDPQTN